MYKMLKLDEIDTHSNRIKCQWRYLENYKWIYVATIGIIDNKKVIVYPYIKKWNIELYVLIYRYKLSMNKNYC